ncbi:MAG: xanthine dehydrogenase family protein molybdopterin-binding subunit [Alphaproteobacteria bacterium]|nr:xanthine dehydrogenase family protein molybdopterin-binding subunit [Alphaproteobacteria bacterium]
MVKFTRRGFMIGGAAVGGTLAAGMAIGVGFLSTVDTDGLDGALREDGTIGLNAWVRITPDGHITFAIPRTEMGQGVFTSLPMLIAEELEVSLDAGNVSVIHPTEALPVYTNYVLALRKRPEELSGAADWLGKKVFSLVPYIGTGGSTSVVDAYTPLRRAGAAARSMLLKAAAERWATSIANLRAENGSVINTQTGERLGYGDLAERAASMSPDRDIPLKPRKQFRLVGKPHPRVDIPAKTRGEAVFGVDVNLPNMLFATVMQSPVFGGMVASFDDTAAMAARGVHKVVNLGNAVGVIAESYYYAKKALRLVKVTFKGGDEKLSSKDISAALNMAVDAGETHVFEEEGSVDTKLSTLETFEARYETPYLAHACMEPMACTALVQDGKVEMWSSSQAPLTMDWAADRNIKDLKEVTSHTMLTGGGFGRKIELDVGAQVVQLAATMPGRPVKLIWSREEDIQHDMYRPAAVARVRAALGSTGMPEAFDYKLGIQSVMQAFSRRNMPIEEDGLKDQGNVEGVRHHPYAFGARRVANSAVELPVPVGSWRSVGHSNNAFFVESFVDELAHKAGVDPFTYRERLLAHDTRLSALMAKLRDLSGWDSGDGKARGVAFHPSFRSFVGQVAEISVDAERGMRVERVTCVVDCGVTVNPDTIRAQMEGGIIFALSAAMHGEITIEGGRVVEENFPSYEMVRMYDTPEIVVHIMENDEAPGGVGEPGVPPLFPAVTNAVFAANGERIRRLPLKKHGYWFA